MMTAMHRLLALYTAPKDPAHFKKYYEETHLPLAGQLPGLLSSRYSFAVQGVGSPASFFCIWEGEFASEAAMDASMQSPVGQKVVADVANYASGGVTIVHYDVKSPSHRPSIAKEATKEAEVLSQGLQVRRDMWGPAASDQLLESATDFTRAMQELVTRYCFGEVWTRAQLDRKTRSMLTIALLVALNKPTQLKVHVRGAISNGLTKDQIREVLLHSMIYAGVPAGYDSFLHATEVLKEMGLE
jgi:4-carboxymuconolactone decarboxylase